MAKVGRPKSENPKGEKFSFRLEADLVKDLDSYCRKHGVTRSVAMRMAVDVLVNGKIAEPEQVKKKDSAMPAFLL